KQNIAGINLQKLLLRMLTATLRRYRSDGAFDQLQQRLLHALTRYVAGNGRVIRLARNLVNFVDVNNATLGFFHIVIALLQQFLNDIFNVFTHITGFGQGGGVGNGKRHIQQARQGFGQQGFTATGRADQQNITFRQLDIVLLTATALQTLVVVVHRHRQHDFGFILANDVLIEGGFNFLRRRQLITSAFVVGFLYFFTNDVVT